MKSLFILVLDGQSDFSIPVIRCLAGVPGVTIHVLSIERWAPSRFSRHTSSYEFLDIGEGTDQRLEVVRDAVRRRHIDVILPVAEDAIRFVASRREDLVQISAVTPTPELQQFELIRNKWGLARFTADHGVPSPCTSLFESSGDVEQFAMGLKFPVLCKPTDRSNGSGIQLCADREAFIRFAKSEQVNESQYVIQEYIEGFDIDCSVLCVEGRILAYTVQKGFISNSLRFAPPVGIEFVQEEKTLGVVTHLIRELKWTGVAHVDLRFDTRDNVPKVIEVNARYWRSLLGSLVAGVNFPHLACRTALGEKYPVPEYRHSRFISKPLSSIRHLLRLPWKTSNVPISFGETNLKFTFQDPLPDLVREMRNLYRGQSWYPERDEESRRSIRARNPHLVA